MVPYVARAAYSCSAVAVGVNGGRPGPEGVLNLTMAAGIPKAARAIEESMQ